MQVQPRSQTEQASKQARAERGCAALRRIGGLPRSSSVPGMPQSGGENGGARRLAFERAVDCGSLRAVGDVPRGAGEVAVATRSWLVDAVAIVAASRLRNWRRGNEGRTRRTRSMEVNENTASSTNSGSKFTTPQAAFSSQHS